MPLIFKDINVLPLVYYPGLTNDNLKYSNKTIMPQMILDKLMLHYNDNIQYPIIFKIKTEIIDFYVGVEEFCSNKNIVYIPNYLIQSNYLTENSKVDIEYCSIPKGSFIKLKPHKTSFTNLTNPKELLEKRIRNYYPVLYKNQTISIQNDDSLNKNKSFLIDVIHCEPFDIISTNNTDISVDFEEPHDYQQFLEKQKKEQEQKTPQKINKTKISNKVIVTKKKKNYKTYKKNNKFIPFSGKSYRLCD